jgi:hypothetical protein
MGANMRLMQVEDCSSCKFGTFQVILVGGFIIGFYFVKNVIFHGLFIILIKCLTYYQFVVIVYINVFFYLFRGKLQ